MPIEFDCPHCGRHYKVADTHAGKRFACKQCGNPAEVPGGEPVVAAPSQVPAPPRASGQAPAVRSQNPPWAPGAEGRPQPLPQRALAPTPYGSIPGQTQRAPRSLNFVLLGGAGAMLLGFFLPWISINVADVFSLSWGGWQLPIEINKLLAKLLDMFSPHAEPGDENVENLKSLKSTATSLYAVYLIPIACLAAGIEEFVAFKKGRNTWWLRALAAASPFIAFIVVFISFAALANQLGGDSSGPGADTSSDVSVFDILGVGIYISFLGFLAVVVSIFVHPRPKGGAPTPYAAPQRRPRPPMPGGVPQAPRQAPGGPRPVRPRTPRPGGPTLPRPR